MRVGSPTNSKNWWNTNFAKTGSASKSEHLVKKRIIKGNLVIHDISFITLFMTRCSFLLTEFIFAKLVFHQFLDLVGLPTLIMIRLMCNY